jgi:IS5 family transposase
MLMALARGIKGGVWFSLIDKIYAERTLQLAWEQVQSNAGACGVDGITIDRFAIDSPSRLLAVKEQLKRGVYQPKPVKRVWIEKPGSAEKRPLGIPTVTDRVVQAAVRMVIEPIFENRFAKHSYGFRPGRGCKDALRRVEELLKATIDTAVQTKAVRPAEFERVIVDTTVQEKAIAHPVDSRLLEIARAKVVQAAKRVGISLKQTFIQEGKELRRKAGGYAHAKQFKRLRRTVKRQRTILGIVLREIGRKLASATSESPSAIAHLNSLLERAERIRKQQPKDKNKLYALHAPEVECIGKGKARKPYEFGVKASIAVTHKSGLMVGARTFPGNPYDGHILSAQLEQTRILLEDVGREPKEVVVDLGFRGVDRDNPQVEIIHRGKYKSLTRQQRRWLKRRQAVEPAIGHLKSDHRMDRCWLQGQLGDALHAVLCATGYNLRWLLRAMVRLGLKAAFLRPVLRALMQFINGDQARFNSSKQNFRLTGALG